jgi:hypothetical protein
MTKVTQQQALDRWDAAPERIREALSSQINSEFLWQTCEKEHLPKEKARLVLQTAGYVVLGFIHPDDFTQELKEAIGINQQIAESIASAVSNRIFAPIKNELDELYAPPSTMVAPKIIEEIKKSPAASIVEPAEISIGEVFGGKAGAKTEMPPATPPPIKPVIGEFAKREAPAKSESATTGKIEPFGAAHGEPPPVIIHEEPPVAKPLQSTPGFKLNIPPPPVPAPKTEKVAAWVRPAVVEIGGAEPPPLPQKTSADVKTSSFAKATADRSADKLEDAAKAPRVVHYTEFRTPLEKTEPPAPGLPDLSRAELPQPKAVPPPATPPAPTRIEPPPVKKPEAPQPQPPNPFQKT